MKRYDQLLKLVDLFKPKTIIEIGTWNGMNACRMIQVASKHHHEINYYGYDLFEDASADTDAAEKNVKGHNSMKDVMETIRKHCPKAGVSLVRGNTRETLKSARADFVFIDGGHSVETIASDYRAVSDSGVIVFDDYYAGGSIDVGKFGCNQLIREIGGYVLPQADPVKGGGFTSLVLKVNY